MVDGIRVHRIVGKESEGVTRSQAEDFIEQARTEARKGRLNLPKGRKVALGFREAAEKYLIKLEKEGGKDLKKKEQRLRRLLSPFFRDKLLLNAAEPKQEWLFPSALSECGHIRWPAPSGRW